MKAMMLSEFRKWKQNRGPLAAFDTDGKLERNAAHLQIPIKMKFAWGTCYLFTSAGDRVFNRATSAVFGLIPDRNIKFRRKTTNFWHKPRQIRACAIK